MDDEPYRLAPAPATRSACHAARIRDERERSDRVARRQPDYLAWRERSFFVTNGADLVQVYDPDENHATLETVLADLTARVQEAHHGKNAAARWWLRDLAIWRAGRLEAIVRPGEPGGAPIVTVLSNEDGRADRNSNPAVSQPAASHQERHP